MCVELSLFLYYVNFSRKLPAFSLIQQFKIKHWRARSVFFKDNNLFCAWNESEIPMEFDWAEHWWIALIVAALLLGLLLHILIESVYFIRMILYFIFAKFIKKKIHILEKCSIKGEKETKLN